MKKLQTALYLIVFAGLAAYGCRQSVTVARETSIPCLSDSDCDDDNPCTQDSCLATKHCSHEDLAGPYVVEGPAGDPTCANLLDDDCDGQADLDDSDCNPGLCNAHGWCWEFPRPQGNTLNAVISFESGDVWAAGAAGTLLHFDGTDWELLDSGTESDLNDIAASAPDDIWAAGREGALVHWNGSQWQPRPSNTNAELKGLFVDSAKNAWMVGRDGFTGRWGFQAGQIQPITSSTNNDLYAIWGAAEDQLWAVGQAGTLLEWNGSQWSSLIDLPGNLFIDIWGSDPDDIWAVGDREFYHKSGGVWQDQSPDFSGLVYSIHGSSPANVWAVGIDGFSWHWNGSVWSMEFEKSGSDLNDVFVLNQNQLWAVGDRGAIFIHENDNWESMTTKVREATNFSAACSNSEDDIWIASTAGDLRHYDGSKWERFYPEEAMAVFDMLCFGNNSVWAVGPQGGLLHWQGQAWSKVSSPSTETLWGLWGVQDNVWAVGANGTILNWLESRGSWLAQDGPSDQDLKGIFGSASDDIWVVGEGGTLLHYNGVQWDDMISPTEEDLTGVWAASKDHAWMLSANGLIFHWNGSDWQLQFDTGVAQNAIFGLDLGDVWTAGSGGKVFRFDGDNWLRVPSGCANSLMDILPMPSKVMVFGQSSSILFFER